MRAREQRGAVVSVRMSTEDAAMLAELAERAGVSVSELSRRVLRQAIHTHWQPHVWSRLHTVAFPVVPIATGGDFTRKWFEPEGRAEDTIVWRFDGCERSVGTL